MSTFGDRNELVAAIDSLLSATYGEPQWAPALDPLSELVLTILSQHTSDRNSGAAFDELSARFGGDWHRVMDALVDQVAAAIRSAGLSNIKAPRIQAVLREVLQRTGALSLDFLGDLELQESKAWLTSLPGVGPKTAACVLMFSFGLPAIPVDTHVHRVSRRLGLIDPKTNAEQAHAALEAIVPAERAYPFHINLIRHGREICKAPRPLCGRCPLTGHCAYFRSIATKSQLDAATAAAVE
ncbi:MAG: endonuclease III [Chloroflexota bacterium]|nr:endonuclease III [Chloroflexota bacterium]